jgi:hypothetical protein
MASKFRIPNPLDYVDGKALGKFLRDNPTPKPKTTTGKPIQLAKKKQKLVRKGRTNV